MCPVRFVTYVLGRSMTSITYDARSRRRPLGAGPGGLRSDFIEPIALIFVVVEG